MQRGKRRAEVDLQPYNKQPSPWGGATLPAETTGSLPAVPELKGAGSGVSSSRAAACLQHVKALNTQFASWVQQQLDTRPDELWTDGVEDYTRHAGKILSDFKEIVEWLKTRANGGPPAQQPAGPPQGSIFGKVDGVPPSTRTSTALFGTTQLKPNSLFPPPGSSPASLFSGRGNNEMPKASDTGQEPANKRMTSSTSQLAPSLPPLPASAWAGLTVPAPPGGGSSVGGQGQSASGSTGMSLFGAGTSGGLLFPPPSATGSPSFALFTGFSSSSSAPGSSTGARSSGSLFGWAASPNQTTNSGASGAGLFSSTQGTSLGSPLSPVGVTAVTTAAAAPITMTGPTPAAKIEEVKEEDGDDEEPEPGGPPMVKKEEEPGVEVLYEVKSKIYVQDEKKEWKDRGVGIVSLKRYPPQEGKEAKDTPVRILFRTEIGKLVMNALLYNGMKANQNKKSVVVVLFSLHEEPPKAVTAAGLQIGGQAGANGTSPGGTSPGGEDKGAQEDANKEPRKTTFLIRVASEEKAQELAAKILEHAPKE